MPPILSADRLADEIREAYGADPENGRGAIEGLLAKQLDGLPEAESQQMLRQLEAHFSEDEPESALADDARLRQVFGMFLGRQVNSAELTSQQFLERLAQSLNTIFDALNQLVSVINTSFSGGTTNGDETIRQFIGFHLDGRDQTRSLEAYLGQINAAFLTSHDAFKKAAHKKVEQIIHALDPSQVARERGSGLKIGPLRKAEDYDILVEKIERIKRWFESGRFMEDFLREFEKNCETLNQNRK